MGAQNPTKTPSPAKPPPTFALLPVEVKSHITSLLKVSDAKALVQTCKSWEDPVEMSLWRSIVLDPGRPSQTTTTQLPLSESGTLTGRPDPKAVEQGTLMWLAFTIAIIRRPVRLSYLKTLRFVAATRFWPLICRIIPLIAPTIEELYLTPPNGLLAEKPNCGCDILDVARCLPRLRTLDITLNRVNQYSGLVSSLRSTPNLEELRVDKDGAWEHPHTLPSVKLFPDLPKLVALHMAIDQDLTKLLPVFGSKAESLRCLHLHNDKVDLSEVPIPRRLGVRAFKTLQNVEVLTIDNSVLARRAMTLLDRPNALPKLQRFITGSPYSLDIVPNHPTLQRYDSCFVMDDDDDIRLGTLERPQESGRLDDWVVEVLGYSEKLSVFTHFPPEAYKDNMYDPKPSISYFVRSYTSSTTDVVLYHVRAHNHDSRIPEKPLSPGRYSKNIAHQDCLPHPVLMDSPSILEVDSWVDLTNYGGWPLPLCLVDYLYEFIGDTRHWETGTRGIQLPDEVSKLLKQWKTEVEHHTPSEALNDYEDWSWEGVMNWMENELTRRG